jgi:uncharacterized protein YecE (DUF72 family)
MNGLRLGTSAFTAKGWPGSFYPPGLKPAEYLSYYATQFNTVEVDSTYYAIPSPSVVAGWRDKVPDGFLLSAKVTETITHQKCLQDCDTEFKTYLDRMAIMGDKLGPLLLQFPYFNQDVFNTGADFVARLKPFLEKLPSLESFRFALEIRNKYWINPPFLDLLRKHNVAFVLQDHSFMQPVSELFEKYDPITSDFTYIRWLGDRNGIEKLTKVWDKTIIDKTADLQHWVKYCRQIQKRGVTILGYFNNHWSGHGPDSVRLFRKLYEEAAIAG